MTPQEKAKITKIAKWLGEDASHQLTDRQLNCRESRIIFRAAKRARRAEKLIRGAIADIDAFLALNPAAEATMTIALKDDRFRLNNAAQALAIYQVKKTKPGRK